MGSAFEETSAERLFKAALAFAEDEREAFVKSSAGDDEELYQMVAELLDGYGRSGGDEKKDTLIADSASRQRWGSSTEEPGATIGPFTLVRQVGEGGMGTVWEAEQSVPLQRRVALKLIKLGMDTAEVVQRFERERQTLALMEHPNIAAVHEAGATALGRPYFAMEFVEGEPITDYCTKHNLSVDERLRLILTVCSGIEHAHRKGVIHRDLKPSNIFVSEEGAPKIIDFGIAKAAADESGTLFTRATQMLGTPAYMSPEQANGAAKNIDTRSDVYSLGVVLYELLAGAPPFDPERLASTGIAEMQKIIAEEEPPTPSTRHTGKGGDLVANLPTPNFEKDLDWIVMKALAKEPERRYQSAAAFGEDLQRYLDGEAVTAVPPTAAYRFGKFVRRNKLAVGAASAVFLALLTGLLVSLEQMRRANEARAQTTYTIADLYTNNGLTSARDGDAPVAALWFANAAVTAEGDPNRVHANQIRTRTWRDEFPSIVRALQPEIEWPSEIQWNPKGLHLIVTSEGGESIIVSLETESTVSLRDAPEGLRFARWSHDGRFLAGNTGNSIAVFSFPSGEKVASVTERGTRLRWSPDDDSIAVAGQTDPFLWRPWLSQRVRLGEEEIFQAIDFSRDGERLLLHGTRATVRSVLEPTTDLFAPVPMNPDIKAGFLGPAGNLIYLGQADFTIEVRDAWSGEILESYAVPKGGSYWGALQLGLILGASPDGNRIAVAGYPMIDRRQKQWDAVQEYSGVDTLVWHPDGRTCAAATNGNDFFELDLDNQTNKPRRKLGETKHRVMAMAYSPTGDYIVGAERTGAIRIWKVSGGGVEPIVDCSPYQSNLNVTTPDSRYLLPVGSGKWTNEMRATRLFDLQSGETAGPQIRTSGILTNGVFSRDGRWCALGVGTGTERKNTTPGRGAIEFWDPFEGRQIMPSFECPSEPRGLAIHPDGRTLAILCADSQMIELDFNTDGDGYPIDFESREIFRHGGTLDGNDFSNNGRCRYSPNGRFLVAFARGKFLLWDRDRADFVEKQTDATTAFATDLRGDVMAASLKFGEDGVGFWDLSSGERLRERFQFTRGAMFVRMDESGGRILTDSYKGSVQVFDVAQGKPIGPAFAHGEDVLDGDFIHGTPWIASGSVTEQMVRFWDPRNGFEIRPPVPQPQSLYLVGIEHLADADRLVVAAGSIRAYATDALFPEPSLDPASALQLAEIDAFRRVRSGGGLDVIQDDEWIKLWRAFRRDHPNFPGHALKKLDVRPQNENRPMVIDPPKEEGRSHLANPSFEEGPVPPRPGYAPIPGWDRSDNGSVQTGVNPSTDGHPFADNGRTPDGYRVGFIQSLGSLESLSTTLTDLTPGTLYKVSFRANSRSQVVPSKPSWSLNGADFVEFDAPAVDPHGTHSSGYHTIQGTFRAVSTTTALVIQNHTSDDSTLLIDDFRVRAETSGD